MSDVCKCGHSIFLGHASVATTALYAVAISDTMRRGAEAAGRIG